MADLRVRCPYCMEETGSLGKRPYGRHVSVNLDKGTFLCWRCGRGKGEVLTKRIMCELGLDNVPFTKARRRRYDAQGNELEDEESVTVEELPDGYEPLYPWKDVKDSIILAPYIRYLLGSKRKLTPKHLRKFKIGAVLDPKVKKWRRGFIVFPLLDKYPGFVLHKTEQAWFKECSSYVNSEGLQRLEGALLNGRILEGDLNPIYVVEGAFDVVAMNNHAVGTLGTGYTEGQFKRLLAVKQDLVIAFDGDAWRAAMVWARRFHIRGKSNVYWVKLPPGRSSDPGRLGWVGVGKLSVRR